MADDGMDLLQGTLDVLVLRALVWGPMHGYAVSRWIHDRTRGDLAVEYAPLYKTLHRLETAGSGAGEWCISKKGRLSRYYRLTTRGRARLKSGDAHWRRYASAVFRVLDAT